MFSVRHQVFLVEVGTLHPDAAIEMRVTDVVEVGFIRILEGRSIKDYPGLRSRCLQVAGPEASGLRLSYNLRLQLAIMDYMDCQSAERLYQIISTTIAPHSICCQLIKLLQI